MLETMTRWEHLEGHPCGRLVVADKNIYHILKGKSDRARKRKLSFHFQGHDQYGYSLPTGAICWIPMSQRQWEKLERWLKQNWFNR